MNTPVKGWPKLDHFGEAPLTEEQQAAARQSLGHSDPEPVPEAPTESQPEISEAEAPLTEEQQADEDPAEDSK